MTEQKKTDQPITTADWVDPKLGNPHQRLAIFSKMWGEHMAWKDGVTAKLDEIQTSLVPSDSDADIVHDMMAVEELQNSISKSMALLAMEKATFVSDIADAKEEIEIIEADASLTVEGKNAAERRSKLIAELEEDEEYSKLKTALSYNERGKLVKQAHLESAEREYKRLGSRIRNLRARLEYLTAQMKSSIGE